MAGADKKLTAKLILPDGKETNLPVIVGTEDEHAIDIRSLRNDTGYITLDSGYMNTGSTTSAITYLDGEQGILRYRGYPHRGARREVELRRDRVPPDQRQAADHRRARALRRPC